jgi:hypothetical protein
VVGGVKRIAPMNYYPETDSLYIDLSEKRSMDSQEISEGVVVDYFYFVTLPGGLEEKIF